MSLGINDLSTGIDSGGMSGYIDKLKTEFITTTSAKIDDVTSVESAINEGWQGVAKDKFMEDFAKLREATKDDLQKEYENLRARLEELQLAYFKADENLYQ